MTLVEFLLARLADDEATARAAICQCGGPACTPELGWMRRSEAMHRLDSANVADHVLAWSPARVLAECAAKRAIIEGHPTWTAKSQPAGQIDDEDWGAWDEWQGTLRLLAAVYSGHPDYEQEWAL